MRARLIKGRKAPNKPKQPTSEQYLSAELPKVLRKFQGKRYTLATASKIVNELQQVIVSATCIEPTWESRVRELREQLCKKAFHLNNSISDGIVFVENVGIYDNGEHNTLCVDGLFAKFNEDGKIGCVIPVKLAYPLSSTCVRDGKFRTHLDGHNYQAYEILTDEGYKNALMCAKIAQTRISKRLDNL